MCIIQTFCCNSRQTQGACVSLQTWGSSCGLANPGVTGSRRAGAVYAWGWLVTPGSSPARLGRKKQQPDTYPIEAGSYSSIGSPHTLFLSMTRILIQYTQILHIIELYWKHIITRKFHFLRKIKIGCILKFIKCFCIVWWYHHCLYPENRAPGEGLS